MVISSTPNYLFEAMAYYDRRANGGSLCGVRTSMIASGDDAQIAHAVALAPLVELESRLNEELDFSQEQIEFYFGSLDGASGGLSCDNRAMVLLRLFIQRDTPFDELIDDMLAMSDEEFAYAAVFGMNGRSEVTMAAGRGELSDYFEMISSSSRSDGVKWRICETLMLRKKHLRAIQPMLAKAIELIRENDALYAPLVAGFRTSCDRNPRFADEMTEKLGSRRSSFCDEPVRLCPLLFAPVGYYVFGSTDDDDSLLDANLLIGVLTEQYFTENKPLFDAGALSSLAILCDKTRFLLLRRIASEPAYGQQLAEEMGMTTPNIYHHMGKLVQAKLVSTKIDRNRNYYTINKSYIAQILDELRETLHC
ncbi:MAG: winged helix-turn-helix domain-containing protein [Clostridia bacterium]|nr:winged helix-turn-helix domain-containing protein [Clostridia bacterium]